MLYRGGICKIWQRRRDEWTTSMIDLAQQRLSTCVKELASMSVYRQYLYRIAPVRPAMLTEGLTDEEEAITAAHFNYLKELMAQGVVILAGRTQNTDYSSHGIIIFKAESDEAARQIVESDPGVARKLFRAELYPYRIALLDAGNAEV